MKNCIKKSFSTGGFMLLLLMIVCALIGVCDGGTVYAADVSGIFPAGTASVGSVASTSGMSGEGKHLPAGETLSVDLTQKVTDQVLMSQYDSEIVQFRPYKTPLDTLLRNFSYRETNSISVRWGNADIKSFETTVDAVALSQSNTVATLTVDNPDIFARTSTIRIDGVYGYEYGANSESGRSNRDSLQLYVKDIAADGKLTCLAVNGMVLAGNRNKAFPTANGIVAGTKLYRLGRAGHEKDVMTDSFVAYPTFEENFVQCFKCQVDTSKWYKKHEKLVEWDQKDVDLLAIFEYKMEMEGSLLYGKKNITFDNSPKKGDVYTCNGITSYIKSEFPYTSFTADTIVDMMKATFTGNTGSNKRILLAGGELCSNILKIDYAKNKDITLGKANKWNIDWDIIEGFNSSLYIVHHDLLDFQGDSRNGYIIDPEYLVRYVFEQSHKQDIDQSLDGTANVDSSITTETWCPGLKYSNCHLKVVAL